MMVRGETADWKRFCERSGRFEVEKWVLALSKQERVQAGGNGRGEELIIAKESGMG